MKLLFSVPTGYHVRELIMPLRAHLEQDTDITQVSIVTPIAAHAKEVFHEFGSKFSYHQNPGTIEEHISLISTLKPDVVVTDTVGHDELDYPILKAASELRIPTLTFIASWDNVWKIERLMQSKKPIHIADHVIVWNTMMKEHLLRLFPEISADTVSIIGAPRLDYFHHAAKIPTKQEVYSFLGFTDVKKPLIHFATTELYPLDYVVKTVTEAIQSHQLPPVNMYASVHPGGKMANHVGLEKLGVTVKFSFGRKDSASHPSFTYQPTEKDIYMLIGLFKHTDVLVNHSSSVALESMIAEVPVINVAYGAPFDWIRWYRSPVFRDFQEHYHDIIADDGTYAVKNRKQLISAINQALTDPQEKSSAWPQTVRKMITTTDGSAGAKVLERIKKTTTL